MWTRAHRLVYERAFSAAHTDLGRAPSPAEMAPYLSPCEREELGPEFALQDELTDLEAVLVPCGC